MAIPHEPTPFELTWRSPGGFFGYFAAVNNQVIGLRIMVTAGAFFWAAVAMALVMRVQLIRPDHGWLSPGLYNQLFTMHGSTMMYLVIVPFLEGLALYMLPMVVGSRDVAFPRLSALGFWAYLLGGLMLFSSFFLGGAPDMGWFAYTPLSGPRYTGLGTDLWLLGLTLAEVAGLAAGAEIVVTTLKLRAPGMSLNRMPVFGWAFLVTGTMIVFAFTPLFVASLLLELDRTVGTAFFDPARGGSSLLWQHLFWFFGHPEVYIMFLPAAGIVSMVTPVFARRPIAGYTLVTMAIVATGFVSFGLWAHHMFTTGLPELSLYFFTAASLMIALAAGTQVFAWIATLWGTKPAIRLPLLYVLGFFGLFVIGGMTGVMVAIVPFDWQVHDTYFVVAHFHYVLVGGVVFPIMGGLAYWLPKITGRMLPETSGRWAFWLSFIGFNLTFFPMHAMGLLGMPRRVYTYPESLNVATENMVSTIGAFVLAAGFALFTWDAWRSARRGALAGQNPWNAGTLEWSMASPPPLYTFYAPPVVHDREPLWRPEGPVEGGAEVPRAVAGLTGAPKDWRATLITDALNAEPQAIHYLPSRSIIPLVVSLALLVLAVGAIRKDLTLAVVGAIAVAVTLALWFWPSRTWERTLRDSEVPAATGLSVFPTGHRSAAWWGLITLIAMIATAFATLYFSYFYLRLYAEAWPTDGLPRPELWTPTAAVVALGASAAAQWGSARWFKAGDARRAGVLQALALGLGASFLAGLVTTIAQAPFAIHTNAYTSVFHTLEALLTLVATAGVAMLGVTLPRLWGPDQGGAAPQQLEIATHFWLAVAALGAATYGVVQLSPYVL
jgi:cytochrome c oxidase subunit I+III